MSATNVIEIGSDLWNARVYAGLSVASELAAGLDSSKLRTISLLSVWNIYRRLGKLNQDLEEIFKGYDRPVPFPAEMPREMIREGRDILFKLYADCKRIQSPLEGIPLHGLISRRAARLQSQMERILDLADWFDAMSTPDEMTARFNTLGADLAKGDVIPLSAVQCTAACDRSQQIGCEEPEFVGQTDPQQDEGEAGGRSSGPAKPAPFLSAPGNKQAFGPRWWLPGFVVDSGAEHLGSRCD